MSTVAGEYSCTAVETPLPSGPEAGEIPRLLTVVGLSARWMLKMVILRITKFRVKSGGGASRDACVCRLA